MNTAYAAPSSAEEYTDRTYACIVHNALLTHTLCIGPAKNIMHV